MKLIVLVGFALFLAAGSCGHLRLIILWGCSVYLLVAHSGDVFRVVKKINSGTESDKRGSEEKGKLAAQAVKAWGELTGPAEQPPTEGTAPEMEHKE